MSWSELERLVAEAEQDPALRSPLRHCRSLKEFLLVARKLGYAVTRHDLRLAREEHRRQPAGPAALKA
ncbi:MULTISPECIES: Nif11-like leader peptide family natural product precursor [unclassified Synechococcus]|jgi:hypothetical protein|uniref:Nif11-like leader peptide family natural product precursor n=1 Tax=unclassified Synechococcus TaxID=2626047 RepID=UPI000B97F99B|nr:MULTISPECIES: Nif11-like leader peptide family natural product precursor [unclassified Synechococcus]MCP9827694.1 Nif11-like leader peptide family natural product precursor [Synechococcus sp. L2F]MCP9846246.1 Nif11-like leader peptide family natural product precursor [Synechococcus sp. Lug-A]